jgi:hypothetical protein
MDFKFKVIWSLARIKAIPFLYNRPILRQYRL